MKSFKDYLGDNLQSSSPIKEMKEPTEFKRLKSLVFYIEQAIKAGNTEAYDELMKAVLNFGDSITMNKHMQAASKLMKFKSY